MIKYFVSIRLISFFFKKKLKKSCAAILVPNGWGEMNAVRNQLFSRLLRLDVAYYDGIRSGDLMSRLSGDVTALVQPFQAMIPTMISSTAQLVGGIIMCFHTSWRLAALAFVTIAPVIYLTDQYARWSKKLQFEYWGALGDAAAKASEAFGNVRTIKAFSTEPAENASYQASTGLALKKAITDAVGSAATISFNNYLDLGGTVLILWYGGTLVLDGRLTVGTLVAFRLYWNMINTAYTQLMNLLSNLTRASGAASRVFPLLDATPDIDHNKGEWVEAEQVNGQLVLENVHFAYQMRPNQKVLDGINLTINKGEVCALVGKSGGGKSTLVHLMIRFYDPKQGKITLDGRDLTTLNLRSVHRHCGLVAQDTQLFACSIRDNIAYGLDEEFETGELCEADIAAAAKDANAHDFIEGFEDGYATKVGERGVRISGGQKQRIALARVFLRRPKLLFLDEATSALDAESEGAVQDALDRLIARKDSTVILVAHRLSTVINADKIAVVDSGQIAECGSHSELLQVENGIYSRLVSKQMEQQANILASEEAVGIGGRRANSTDTVDDRIAESGSGKKYAK